MTSLIEFFSYLSLAGGVIIFIAKKIIDKTLDGAIENYKNGLSIKLEEFKSELNRINTEHQIKYNRLHEERAQKVKLLHDCVYESEKRPKSATSTFQGPDWSKDDSRENAVVEKLEELTPVLELNRLYFSDELCKKIEDILSRSWDIVRKMGSAKMKSRHEQYNVKPNEYLDIWIEAESFVVNEMKDARMDLVNEVRQLIGVQ